MSNTRELLELAAKAAGIKLVWTPGNTPTVFKGLSSDEFWNPIYDDGDALRLAVKLRLSVCVELDQTWIASHGFPTTPVCFVDHGDDQYAATRLAIVRAAAEIGRAMP